MKIQKLNLEEMNTLGIDIMPIYPSWSTRFIPLRSTSRLSRGMENKEKQIYAVFVSEGAITLSEYILIDAIYLYIQNGEAYIIGDKMDALNYSFCIEWIQTLEHLGGDILEAYKMTRLLYDGAK